MKIQLTKRDLESALSTVMVCSTSGTDIYSNIYFRVEDGDFRILSSNGRAGVIVPVVTTSIDGEGTFAVESWRISKWISSVGDSALTFEVDGKKLSIKSDKTTLHFPCLGSDEFPFWDAVWEKASEQDPSVVGADFLSQSLTRVKSFVAQDRDTDSPQFAVTETFGNQMAGADATIMAQVESPLWEGMQLRIHGKDISTVTKFLKTAKKGDVKIYPSESETFIERADGAVFVIAKPPTEMVKRTLPSTVDFTFKVSKSELESAMSALLATANKDEDSMTVRFKDAKMRLAVETLANVNDVEVDIQIEKPCDSLPDVITFSPALLTKAIENTVQDELTFDVVVIRRDGELRGGLFRVVEKNDDSVFSVVLIWKI